MLLSQFLPPSLSPETFVTEPGGTSGKELPCQCRRSKRLGFDPWVRKIPWRRAWQPTPVFSPEESHGQRSLAGYSLWGHKESDTAERLTHTSYSRAIPPSIPSCTMSIRTVTWRSLIILCREWLSIKLPLLKLPWGQGTSLREVANSNSGYRCI